MKTVELSNETRGAQQGLTGAENPSPEELLAEGGFRALTDAAERYLALLAWCAANYASDFADFISHQESGHRYLMLSRDEIQEVRAHNHARQIDGTPFWAVMTIDSGARRRFVRRLLEFIGCRDESVSEACRALDLPPVVSERSRE